MLKSSIGFFATLHASLVQRGKERCNCRFTNLDEHALALKKSLAKTKIKLPGHYSAEEIVNLGKEGIKDLFEESLSQLRILDINDPEIPLSSIPPSYQELMQRLRPTRFTEAKFPDDPKDGDFDFYEIYLRDIFTSSVGFIGHSENFEELIFKDALTFVKLRMSYEDFLLLLAELSECSSENSMLSQGSPFGDSFSSNNERWIFTRPDGISPTPIDSLKKFENMDIYNWDQYFSYSCLIPYFVDFWRFFQGRGSEYRLHPERVVWMAGWKGLVSEDAQRTALIIDLENRKEDISLALKILKAITAKAKAESYFPYGCKEMSFSVLSTILMDKFIRRIVRWYGNKDVASPIRSFSDYPWSGSRPSVEEAENYLSEAERVIEERIRVEQGGKGK